MSAYGHPPSYGPAEYGSAGYGSGRHEPGGYDHAHDSYGGYTDSYTAESYGDDPYPRDRYEDRHVTPTPTPTTGRAPAGRARVSASAAVAAPAPAGEDTPSHKYDWGGAGRQRPASGRASVPVSPGVGPAASGRARVRGEDGRPGGPSRPGGRGGEAGKPQRKKKRHWIRNSLLTILAVIVIATGGGMVALSYYVDSVVPPEQQDLPEGSTVYYADGKEMAVLQDVNREIIDTTVPELENARNAVIAAEDKGFHDHSGVDFFGIVRAAVNNFTGGETQGASTIDQQYAGGQAGTRGDESYARKLEEAAMAYNMNRDYSKEEILDFYLNTIYFGRGAHGIQAAAEAYYGKGATELTFEEAAVVAGCIRLPDDGTGLCPYDPLHTPDDPSAAEERFRYVLGQAVDMGAVDQATADAMVLPEVIEPRDPKEPLKGPQGNIVKHVQAELEAMGYDDWDTGGYRITTTIDPDVQKAARQAARCKKSRKDCADYWTDMPENVNAALVAVDPATGGVLAYYGGDDGTGTDNAGPYELDDGTLKAGYPPGSTAKIYTLMAALTEGVSFQSHWQTDSFQPPWRDGDQPIHNANRVSVQDCPGGEGPDYCTLEHSTIISLNVPFAYFSMAMQHEGPPTIVKAAMDAGITMISDEDGNVYDLTTEENTDEARWQRATEVAPEVFFHEVAIGQYPITVLDHANGVATLAARGIYRDAHFVAKVEEKGDSGEWEPIASDQVAGEQRIRTEVADAITGVLSKIPTSGMMGNNSLANGRPAAAKTGTWEHTGPDGFVDGNADAWVVGYTPQIATAVWVGDPKRGTIEDQFGGDIGSSGLPAQIWKQFMDAAHEAKELPPDTFPPATAIGDDNHRYANGIEPEPEDDPFCRGPFRQLPQCQDDDDDDDNGGGNGGGGDGGIFPIEPPPPPPLPGE